MKRQNIERLRTLAGLITESTEWRDQPVPFRDGIDGLVIADEDRWIGISDIKDYETFDSRFGEIASRYPEVDNMVSNVPEVGEHHVNSADVYRGKVDKVMTSKEWFRETIRIAQQKFSVDDDDEIY